MKPQTLVRVALLVLGLVSIGGLAAADVYILPSGAGSKNGSSWANATDGTTASFQVAWNSLSPGDTLHVGSGTYPDVAISNSISGAKGKPLRLVGEDRGSGLPLFTSNFDKTKPDKSGAMFFQAKEGTTDFEIEGIRLKGYRGGVFLRGRHVNLKFSKLDIEQVREGIRSEGGGTPENPDAGTHNVTVSDCRFVHFTKRGFRLEGGNYQWKVERCFADAGGKEWATEPFQMGYQVANKSLKGSASFEHHIEFFDCVALNSYHEAPRGQRYWNGDGFCAESGVKNLLYVRCVSMHHTDGGWDDKSESPEFIDCVALDNKDNFRLWSTTGAAKMTNCLVAFAHKRGGSGAPAGVWAKGNIEAKNCTFYDNAGSHFTGDFAKLPDAKIVCTNSIFASSAGSTSTLGAPEQVKLVDSIHSEAGNSQLDPQIKAKKGAVWQNGGRDFESAKYPAKGFSITRWSKPTP